MLSGGSNALVGMVLDPARSVARIPLVFASDYLFLLSHSFGFISAAATAPLFASVALLQLWRCGTWHIQRTILAFAILLAISRRSQSSSRPSLRSLGFPRQPLHLPSATPPLSTSFLFPPSRPACSCIISSSRQSPLSRGHVHSSSFPPVRRTAASLVRTCVVRSVAHLAKLPLRHVRSCPHPSPLPLRHVRSSSLILALLVYSHRCLGGTCTTLLFSLFSPRQSPLPRGHVLVFSLLVSHTAASGARVRSSFRSVAAPPHPGRARSLLPPLVRHRCLGGMCTLRLPPARCSSHGPGC